ncbi:MAG: nuclear transport factor 2 family protein [Pseudomonadota bacterium]
MLKYLIPFVAFCISIVFYAQSKVDADNGAPLSAEDRLAIIALASMLDTAVDAKDWAAANAFFTQSIDVRLPGAPATTMKASELVAAWEHNLFAEKKSFHLRGDEIVEATPEGDIRLLSKAYAWNHLPGMEGGELWEVWGDYTYGIVEEDGTWKISSFEFQPVFDRGNAAVPGFQKEQSGD